jgi:aryl-alcohol dehydrogenase-like predicted oxidoreductase
VIGFGAWEIGGDAWGPNPPEDQVLDAVGAALDAGITWIDTAEVYGGGTSERLVGRAIAGRRGEVMVATKVGPGPTGTGFRADEVRLACEGSLSRMGTGHIDLYQLHWPDERGVPLEETWGAMAGLVEAGLVRSVGLSNFDQDEIETCLRIRHVDSLQPHFSLLHLEHRELIRWCGTKGIGVVPYGPLAFGLLTGAITTDTRFDRRDWRSGRGRGESYRAMFAPGKLERSVAVADGLKAIAGRLEITPAQLALAWTHHQPGVTSPIAGSRDPRHARENAAAGDVRLDQSTLDEIEALIPLGPEYA